MLKCKFPQCANPAEYLPEGYFYASGHSQASHDPARLEFQLPLCETHKNGFKLEDLVSDSNFGYIERLFELAGFARPTLDGAFLRFIPISKSELFRVEKPGGADVH